jgi:cytochrome c oxidase subunit 3
MDATLSRTTGPVRKKNKLHAKEFLLWAFMVSVFMIFAGLTSAVIVRRADGNWLEYVLPSAFWWSTAFVLLSSISLQWSLVQARRDELGKLKLGLVLTLFLGLLFLFSQWVAFQQMVSVGLYLVGNPSTSFLYVITGLHGLHMLSAVVVLFVIFAQVFRYKVHSKNMLSIRLGTLYWHFLGVLWIYLYVFFQLIF